MKIIGLLSIISALMIINVKNPVHAVLHLILVFLNATALLIMLNIEFIAMMLLIIYIGAVAILFLFVIMMLNIKRIEILENQLKYLPLGSIIGILFIFELILILRKDLIQISTNLNIEKLVPVNWEIINQDITSIKIIGNILFTEYSYFLLLVSLILLVGMIGAIILTLKIDETKKRQNISYQINVDYKDSMKLI